MAALDKGARPTDGPHPIQRCTTGQGANKWCDDADPQQDSPKTGSGRCAVPSSVARRPTRLFRCARRRHLPPWGFRTVPLMCACPMKNMGLRGRQLPVKPPYSIPPYWSHPGLGRGLTCGVVSSAGAPATAGSTTGPPPCPHRRRPHVSGDAEDWHDQPGRTHGASAPAPAEIAMNSPIVE
jgi:hypothetical protein